MPSVHIDEPGCRGCTLCVDVCPVEVFDYQEERGLASVRHQERCIGCLSCAYACPSQCVEVSDYLALRPFHRIEGHAALIRKFLQEKPLEDHLTGEDLEEAWLDLSARLLALSDTITETIGTGFRAVARRAGTIAAGHLPEMYEAHGFAEVLGKLRSRFAHAFTFDFDIDGDSAALHFKPCGLCRVVESHGEKVGDALLCNLFHEYWVGLLSAFVDRPYRCEVPVAGPSCEMRVFPAG